MPYSCGHKRSVLLKFREYSRAYGHRKVWREGKESGCQWCCGSQGKKRVEWIKPEHPYTAISPKSEVHANHNEAHNSAHVRNKVNKASVYGKSHLTQHFPKVLQFRLLMHGFSKLKMYGLGKVSRYLGWNFPIKAAYGSYLVVEDKY